MSSLVLLRIAVGSTRNQLKIYRGEDNLEKLDSVDGINGVNKREHDLEAERRLGTQSRDIRRKAKVSIVLRNIDKNIEMHTSQNFVPRDMAQVHN